MQEFEITKTYRNVPKVALVGRPNVGKSTLFNRLAHQRRAITDPTPGVTRDPVAAQTVMCGKPVTIIDTGGFRLEKQGLDRLVTERALETAAGADLIVLMLEVGETNAEDEEFIRLLRPFRQRTLVAINKTEGGRREQEAWNLLSYGFERVYLISAEHGDHVRELEQAIISRLDFSRLETDDSDRPISIALLGKPNTGKSTLSNRLTSSEASLVSDRPGTTRDVVEGGFCYRNRRFRLLDTAGIRRKSKVTENIEYYSVHRAIKSIEQADLVFLIIDAQEGLSDQDKKIAALAHEKGRGVILALNKWDTMPQVKNAATAAADRIRFLFGQMEYAPVIPISALDGSGVDKLLETGVTMYRQLVRRVDTSRLNQALERWLAEYPPPVGPKTRFKIKYGTQISDNPVKFIFFASRPAAVSEAYIAYLRNKARRDLGFSLVPVAVEIRGSSGREERERRT
ncbi:MAG: ribosome biogenesis GTPase Der [Spirochaetaceae bacterium]|jgi:GTP-binding protein|nr:ribosome biogenesis GTPase Der [Spirochaetaceae bacterium]